MDVSVSYDIFPNHFLFALFVIDDHNYFQFDRIMNNIISMFNNIISMFHVFQTTIGQTLMTLMQT